MLLTHEGLDLTLTDINLVLNGAITRCLRFPLPKHPSGDDQRVELIAELLTNTQQALALNQPFLEFLNTSGSGSHGQAASEAQKRQGLSIYLIGLCPLQPA